MPKLTEEFDAIVPAPFGGVGISVANEYVTDIKLISEPVEHYCIEQPFVQHAALNVQQYLNDAANLLDIPYVLQGTPFQRRVWQAMTHIPLGQVWTYGELAERVGSGPRAVANVCGANHLPLLIPCHRIVSKAGIGGFMQGDERGLEIKRWLLGHEQVNGYC